jgi:uncharacterized protein (DUF4415 family)
MRARGDAVPTGPDAPEVELDADFWRNARLVMPQKGKTSIHLRVDTEVLDWFRGAGKGHLSRMNAVLKAYVEAQRHKRSA